MMAAYLMVAQSIEGLENKPDKRQRSKEQRDCAGMIQVVTKPQGFVAKVIGAGAAQGRDQILPKFVARFALRTLQEQHDKAGENHHRCPVVDSLHFSRPPVPVLPCLYAKTGARPLSLVAVAAGRCSAATAAR